MRNIQTQFKLIIVFSVIALGLSGCIKLPSLVDSSLEVDQDYIGIETENEKDTIVNSIVSLDNYLESVKHEKPPITIVIDNLSSSWPSSGLGKALVVYETPVEADITRLLAVFNQDSLPVKIGPVRSARPYLADLADEYKGLFVHAGGSPQALSNIKGGLYNFYNLDEVSGDGIYFWRDTQRSAPHNLYILLESIERVIEKKDLPSEIDDKFLEWERGENLISLEEVNSSIIKIDYQEPVIWQFDKSMNSYLRYQENEPFLDEEGQIKSPNVVIQKTEIKILDAVGRRSIKTIGQGEAFIFQSGQVIEGSWTKNKTTNRTFFYDQMGEKIKFLPGSIWVEIVGENHKIFY